MLRQQIVVAALMAWNGASAAPAEPRFLGRAEIPGTSTDLSQQTSQLEDGSPSNRFGGCGSGIAWLGQGNQYVMISDRGPGDGATSYRCRFHLVDIVVDKLKTLAVRVELRETRLLTHRSGLPLIGASNALTSAGSKRGLRFDPEAIRASGHGSFFVSDEYGPSILEFNSQGEQIGEVLIPARYHVSKPSAEPEEELPPANVTGRQPNKGMECLAISADGEILYGLMQGPLLQDGALDAEKKKTGANVRLLEIQRRTGAIREFLYPLESPHFGCSEIETIAPGRFLVIERDRKPGTPGSVKRLYEISLHEASDISKIDSLPPTGVPNGVRPVTKRLFLDLLDPRWGLANGEFPAKIEGVALGPKLNDGSRLLLITSDNDFKPDEATYVFAFAVSID
jgi:hypothetical protein